MFELNFNSVGITNLTGLYFDTQTIKVKNSVLYVRVQIQKVRTKLHPVKSLTLISVSPINASLSQNGESQVRSSQVNNFRAANTHSAQMTQFPNSLECCHCHRGSMWVLREGTGLLLKWRRSS